MNRNDIINKYSFRERDLMRSFISSDDKLLWYEDVINEFKAKFPNSHFSAEEFWRDTGRLHRVERDLYSISETIEEYDKYADSSSLSHEYEIECRLAILTAKNMYMDLDDVVKQITKYENIYIKKKNAIIKKESKRKKEEEERLRYPTFSPIRKLFYHYKQFNKHIKESVTTFLKTESAKFLIYLIGIVLFYICIIYFFS